MSRPTKSSSSALRRLPSLEKLLNLPALVELEARYGRGLVLNAARNSLTELRQSILSDDPASASSEQSEQGASELDDRIQALPTRIAQRIEASLAPSLRPAINATGVIIHTNLGRAPLSQAALRAVTSVASAYSNLEFDLDKAQRGSRHRHASTLLRELFPNHQALVVNNAAAGVMLALNTLAEGQEVVISRGELVEIGGSFRIPDILSKSGARLREVGTTNKTRLSDYENAISDNTGVLLRVHPSNFRIVGFTESVSTAELVGLATPRNIPVVEDFGSGNLESLASYGLAGEPWVSQSLTDGVDLTIFSGDKLLGGPQAGILVGRESTVTRCKSNPMARALRVGKLTYAALEATLASHVRGSQNTEIPVLAMIAATPDALQERAESMAEQLVNSALKIDIEPSQARVGGGAAPDAELESVALCLTHPKLSAAAIAQTLRQARPSIVGRIAEDRVHLDLRTVFPSQDDRVVRVLLEF